MTDARPSYHDLYVTTPRISRTALCNLPYRVQVHCTRTAGWQCWAMEETGFGMDLPEELLGGEYDYDPDTGKGNWLVLDVNGHIICDGRRERSAASEQNPTA